MVLQVLFWVLMILMIIGLIFGYTGTGPAWFAPTSIGLLFVEVFILGLRVFGNPAKE